MKIVDRAAFLALPAGTLYAKWGQPGERNNFSHDGLTIMAGAFGDNDWVYQDLVPWPKDCDGTDALMDRWFAMQDDGVESGALDFEEGTARDGYYDQDQLFLVFDRADAEGLVARLQRALAEGYDQQPPESETTISGNNPSFAITDELASETTLDADDPEHWSHQGADYNGQDCKNCGRERVLFYEPVNRRICEKCNWDQDADEYATDHHAIG